MIRVLQVFASLNVGGAESRMMDVYRHLDRSKFQFDFLTMQLEEQYFENEIRALGGKVIKIAPPRQSGTRANLKAMTKILKEGKYEAVHAHTSYHCGMVMLAAKRAGVPIRISHSRTTGSKHSGKKAQIMLGIGRFLINRYATDRLAISNEAGEYLFAKKIFTVIPNAIDLSRYEKRNDSVIEEQKREFSLLDADVILGQVGRFDNMKNHGFTLKLFKEYLKKQPKAKLVLVGDGPLREQREKETQELGLRDRVVFTGVRSDIPDWMYLFKCLLVPSVFEGLGGVILEGQAAGTPVLKSDSFTDAADLDIGLVERCKLDDLQSWLNALDHLPVAVERKAIVDAFDRTGYSLTSAVTSFCKIYLGDGHVDKN